MKMGYQKMRKTVDHKVILEPFPQQFERSRRNLLAFSAILFCFFYSGLYEKVSQQTSPTPPSGLWDVFIWLQQTLPWVWPVLSTYFFLSFFLQALSYWQENRLRLSGEKLSEFTSGARLGSDGKPRNNTHNTAVISIINFLKHSDAQSIEDRLRLQTLKDIHEQLEKHDLSEQDLKNSVQQIEASINQYDELNNIVIQLVKFDKGLKLYGYTQLADKLMIGTLLPLLFGLFTLIISS